MTLCEKTRWARSRRLSAFLLPACLWGWILFTAAPGAAAAPADAATDVVFLSNGDRVTGHFLRREAAGAVFEGSLTGTLFLKWSDVQEIKLGNSKVAEKMRSADPALAGKFTSANPAGADSASYVVASFASSQKTAPAAPSQTAASADQQPAGFLEQWSGQLQSQNAVIVSTQHQYQLGGSLNLGRVTQDLTAIHHQATSIYLQATFGESAKPDASPVRTALYEGVLQHNVYLTDDSAWRVFAVADFYHNLSLGVNYEQSYGGGIARDWQHGSQAFGFGADIRFEGEYLYAPGRNQELGAAGLSEYYSIPLVKINKQPLTFIERTTFIPAFGDSLALQARGMLKLTLPVTTRFCVGLQENDDFLRNSPHTVRENYSNTQFTLSYLFGPLPKP